MQELVQAIKERGCAIGDDIVKVDMFLNHQIDTALMMRMGQEFADIFRDEKPDRVLTIEASGIAIALATAVALGNIPLVFAKKSQSRNNNGDMYQTSVYSFTRDITNQIRIPKNYLPAGERVLIIDDFLANGAAANGLVDLLHQAGCQVAGIGVCVEKSFQPGHKLLEEAGYKVVTLAKVTSIHDGHLEVGE